MNFDAPDAHFDNQCLFSDAQTKNCMEILKKEIKTYEQGSKVPKMSQNLRTRAMPEGDMSFNYTDNCPILDFYAY